MPVPGFNGIIDLSHHRQVSDWASVAGHGIVAVIHKATEGGDFRDPQYPARRETAREFGLLWGSYHFATAAEPARQAENYLTYARPDAGDLICLDYEPHPSGASMSPAQLVAFIELIHERLDRFPVLYGGSFLAEAAAGLASPLLARCPLWQAGYAEAPPRGRWTLWQYTDGTSGPEPRKVDGIGPCDRNVYAGTEAGLRRNWPFSAPPEL